MNEKYFGKYRAKVVNNQDPRRLGRLQVNVVALLGRDAVWAMPCVPYAGPNQAFLVLPENGSNIWVEFEGGRLEDPIWTGCFWLENELPAEAQPGNFVLRTPVGALIMEEGGKLRLELSSGNLILEMDQGGGLRLDNGQGATIELQQTMVKINNDALEIV